LVLKAAYGSVEPRFGVAGLGDRKTGAERNRLGFHFDLSRKRHERRRRRHPDRGCLPEGGSSIEETAEHQRYSGEEG
jgi:hypothetical protein